MQDAFIVARRLASHIYKSADVPLTSEPDNHAYGSRRLRNAGVVHARRMQMQRWLAEYGGLAFIIIFAAAILLSQLPW